MDIENVPTQSPPDISEQPYSEAKNCEETASVEHSTTSSEDNGSVKCMIPEDERMETEPSESTKTPSDMSSTDRKRKSSSSPCTSPSERPSSLKLDCLSPVKQDKLEELKKDLFGHSSRSLHLVTVEIHKTPMDIDKDTAGTELKARDFGDMTSCSSSSVSSLSSETPPRGERKPALKKVKAGTPSPKRVAFNEIVVEIDTQTISHMPSPKTVKISKTVTDTETPVTERVSPTPVAETEALSLANEVASIQDEPSGLKSIMNEGPSEAAILILSDEPSLKKTDAPSQDKVGSPVLNKDDSPVPMTADSPELKKDCSPVPKTADSPELKKDGSPVPKTADSPELKKDGSPVPKTADSPELKKDCSPVPKTADSPELKKDGSPVRKTADSPELKKDNSAILKDNLPPHENADLPDLARDLPPIEADSPALMVTALVLQKADAPSPEKTELPKPTKAESPKPIKAVSTAFKKADSQSPTKAASADFKKSDVPSPKKVTFSSSVLEIDPPQSPKKVTFNRSVLEIEPPPPNSPPDCPPEFRTSPLKSEPSPGISPAVNVKIEGNISHPGASHKDDNESEKPEPGCFKSCFSRMTSCSKCEKDKKD